MKAILRLYRRLLLQLSSSTSCVDNDNAVTVAVAIVNFSSALIQSLCNEAILYPPLLATYIRQLERRRREARRKQHNKIMFSSFLPPQNIIYRKGTFDLNHTHPSAPKLIHCFHPAKQMQVMIHHPSTRGESAGWGRFVETIFSK